MYKIVKKFDFFVKRMYYYYISILLLKIRGGIKMLNKKSIKILSIIIMVVMLLIAVGNVALGLSVTIPQEQNVNTSAMDATIGKVFTVIQYIGIIVAVIMAMYLGITYITKSPEGKADIKKQLPLFIGGIVLLLSASVIVGLIGNAIGGEGTIKTSTSAIINYASIIK